MERITLHSLSTKIGVKFQLLFCHARRDAVTVKIQNRNIQVETQPCVCRLKLFRYVYMLTHELRSQCSRFATQRVYKESLVFLSSAEQCWRDGTSLRWTHFRQVFLNNLSGVTNHMQAGRDLIGKCINFIVKSTCVKRWQLLHQPNIFFYQFPSLSLLF